MKYRLSKGRFTKQGESDKRYKDFKVWDEYRKIIQVPNNMKVEGELNETR